MTYLKLRGAGAMVLLGGLILSAMAGGQEAAPKRDGPVLRVGMASSYFQGISRGDEAALTHTLGLMTQSQTGAKAEFFRAGDAFQLGQLLTQGGVHLAVFHGIEFAWVNPKFPDLRPLVVVVNQDSNLQALILVRRDDKATGFSGLKGRTIAGALPGCLHGALFLERLCRQAEMMAPERFFTRVVTPANAEDAIDKVIDGGVDAAVIDQVAFECYQRRKPARAAKTNALIRSEKFPAGVVAYRQGAIDSPSLDKLRQGMVAANKIAGARQFMTLWKMTGFEPVPEDYPRLLNAILKTYPVPSRLPDAVSLNTQGPQDGTH
jgi:ABC-type phosphate/phosphonate transport system substrate-binding protein